MGRGFWKGLACAAFAVLLACPAWATGSALMESPARNAAVIAKIPGFKSYNLDLYLGKRTINEGVVIRKSRIENGKIIIPPGGLYYSSRIASIGTMTQVEVVLLGKRYSQVNEATQYIILKDRTLKLGEKVNLLDDGSRALQFVDGKSHPYGSIADYSAVKILKASGNYYGTNFQVSAHPTLKDFSTGKYNGGMGKPEGRYPISSDGPDDFYHNTYFGSSTYPSGQSYLIVGKTSAKEVEVKEFGTPSITRLWLTATPRVSGAYAKGDKAAIGKSTVEVLAVSPESVTLRLTGPDGKALEKTFKGLGDPAALDYLPSSAPDRAKYQLASADGATQIQIAMLKKGGPVADGKVNLDMYADVFTLDNPQPWPTDTRFLARPDT